MDKKLFQFDASDLSLDKSSSCCSTEDKNSSCCSSTNEDKNMKDHWDKIFQKSDGVNLEWYEEVAEESLSLIEKCSLSKNAKIVNIGAGTSTLLKSLSQRGFNNLWAVDISLVALDKLKDSLFSDDISINLLEDDLTNSKELIKHKDIDLWHDRAAFHFFSHEDDRRSYFELIKNSVKLGSHIILAPFNKEGVDKCSGLDVYQYSLDELKLSMGNDFELTDSFNHVYNSPKGNKKHFIYSMFRRIK